MYSASTCGQSVPSHCSTHHAERTALHRVVLHCSLHRFLDMILFIPVESGRFKPRANSVAAHPHDLEQPEMVNRSTAHERDVVLRTSMTSE